MASFDGVTIYVRAYSLSGQYDSDVAEQPIPGSAITYYDLGGKRDGRVTLRLKFLSFAALEIMLAKRQTEGTLTYARGTFTAILKSISPGNAYPNGVNFADAEFIVL